MPVQLVSDVVLAIPAGATTTQTSPDFNNSQARGLSVTLDMTAVGTGSVTLTIQGKDRASGKYYTLLAGAAVVTNVTNRYVIYPAYPVVANVSANEVLPAIWRIVCTANNANPATYSVGATMLV